jgi:hypothetical protein
MKKLIAIAVALVVIFAAAPAALACWTRVSCKNPTGCTGTINYIEPGFCAGTNWQIGQAKKTHDGMRCSTIDGPGSAGCTWGIKMYNGGALECGVGLDPCCLSKAVSTLTGIGCCQAPCPPNIPNCHEN